MPSHRMTGLWESHSGFHMLSSLVHSTALPRLLLTWHKLFLTSAPLAWLLRSGSPLLYLFCFLPKKHSFLPGFSNFFSLLLSLHVTLYNAAALSSSACS